MAKDGKCGVCRHSGLYFLFTRVGAYALPKSLVPPMWEELVQSDQGLLNKLDLPQLKQARYVLRLLRVGYLHIYHKTAPAWLKKIRIDAGDKDPTAANWEVYRVTKSGALIPDYEQAFSNTSEDFHCTTDPTHIFTALGYRLRDAHAVDSIQVAFSSNLWNAKLRAQNIGNGAMHTIDVAAIRAGKNIPSRAVSPDSAWIDKHIVEFASGTTTRKGLDVSGWRSYYHQGKVLTERMRQQDSLDASTSGKSVIYVLPDAVGTGIALAEIARDQHERGVEIANAHQQKLDTAAKLAVLKKQASEKEELRISSKWSSMDQLLMTRARGETVDRRSGAVIEPMNRSATGDRLIPLPPQAERSQWLLFKETDSMGFITEVRGKTITETAYFAQYRGSSRGMIFVPASDMAEKSADEKGVKMNSLFNKERMQAFLTKFNGEMEDVSKILNEHDEDRSYWLTRIELQNEFNNHYDEDDKSLNPALAMQRDAHGVLVSWGGVSVSLESAIKGFLDAKPSQKDGWALRSIVANQKALYSEQETALAAMGDWLFNMDNKLDKSYDTWKFLLTEVVGGEKLKIGRAHV